MAAGEEDGLALEGMRTDDHSWNPCQVSLSSCTSAGSGLVVDFENCNLREIISTKEEALARLRIRSVPLQDGECLQIKEGEHIIAMHTTQTRSLFFDAEVEKILRVRHSLRVLCRCIFGIKWLHPEMKGETMNISSSSVRKLSGKGIHSHPTVAAFLNTVSPWHSSGAVLEDISYKTGIQRLLEEQIEDIIKVADAPSKAVSDDILFGVKNVEHAGCSWSKAFVTSEISAVPDKIPYNENTFGRSTMNQRKLELGMESKDLPLFQPSPEEHFQKPSCLSPLAARAALASLMHESPQKPKISIYHLEKEGYVDMDTPQNTLEKHMDVVSLDVTRMVMNSDICIQQKLSVESDNSSVVASMPVTSNPIEIANSAFGVPMLESRSLASGSRGSLEMSQLEEDSHGTVTLQEKSIPIAQVLEDGSLNASTINTRLTRSVMNRKSNNTTITARATCSTIQDIGNETNKAKLMPSAKHGNLSCPTTTKRLTRSANQKERGNSVNEVNMATSAKDREPNNPTITTRITRSANQKEPGMSVNEFKLELSTKDSPAMKKRLTHLAVQKKRGQSVNEVNTVTSTKDREPNSPTIMTRNMCSGNQKEPGKSVNEIKLEHSTTDSATMTKRGTRSAIQKAMGRSVNELNTTSPAKSREPNSPTTMTRVTRLAIQKAEKSVTEFKMESSSKDKSLNSPDIRKLTGLEIQNDMGNSDSDDVLKTSTRETKSARIIRSASQKEMGNSVKEVEFESSTKDGNLSSPAITTRLTRSTSQKIIGNSVNNVKLDAPTKDRNLDTPTTRTRSAHPAIQGETRSALDGIDIDFTTKERKTCSPPTTARLTRSALQREIESSVNRVRIESAAKDIEYNYPPVTKRLTRSAAGKEAGYSTNEVRIDSSSKGRKLNDPPITRFTHCTSREGFGSSVDEVELDSSTKGRNSMPISSRVTRSAAKREPVDSVAEVEKGWKKRKLTRGSRMDGIVDLGTLKSKECKSSMSQRKRKMVKVSSTIIIINDDSTEEGEISGQGRGQNSAAGEGLKAKKPQSRFSHRLRFLPRTRSQRKNLLFC